MPTSTSRYRFEFHMVSWAREFVAQLTDAECAFFMALREDSSLRRIYVSRPRRVFGVEQKSRMIKQSPRWLLYSPYHDEGSAYLEWTRLEVQVAERWTGRRFERDDYLDVRSTGAREEFPETWSVIIS